MIDLQLYEVALGTVVLFWSAIGMAPPPSFTLIQNGQPIATPTGFTTTVQGLLVNTAYAFRVVANYAQPLQSEEIDYQYGSNEIMTVTLMPRPWNCPFPSVLLN